MITTRFRLIPLCLAGFGLLLGGFGTSCTPSQEGAFIGGALGAAAGTAVADRDPVAGAVVGGLLGAAAGAVIADDDDYYDRPPPYNRRGGHGRNRYGYDGPPPYDGYGPLPSRRGHYRY